MRIVVAGAGKVGYYLIKTLLERGHHVSLVEIDPKRCRVVAQETGILTVCADATRPSALGDAGADTADVVAAVTGMDEVNLVVAQVAKKCFGTGRVVARVNNPKNREVLQRLGADIAISGTALIADSVEQSILYDVRRFVKLDRRSLSMVEIPISAQSEAVGMPISSIARHLPDGCVLVAVSRGDDVIIPRGRTVLLPDDSVVALVKKDQEHRLWEFFGKGGE